ncbi:MAG: carbohydrate kinase [Verrucomicrobia bacterium]|jgi:sugar/nucleoside kinase (ribokinase family)|nr:carbohydrate kinase [Verrucomicrobiota bacterium]|tara:strand:+ start:7731 stop:8711 length:981 start_codon:yes stop_codon:yes gene_type:complete
MPIASTPVLVGGSIAIDNIKTPTAEGKNLLGGSASFTGIAASYFTDPVHLVGIIGKDFPQEHLDHFASKGISTDGLERSEGDTFSWTGSYHENMNDRDTLAVDINVLEDWTPKVPAEMASAPIVVLANMHPLNQLQFIEQLTAQKPFIAADTMDLWITIANDDLEKVLKKIDLLVINESEARDFCKTSNLIIAGERLLEKGLKNAVIKLGEFGAILFSKHPEGAIHTEFSLPGKTYDLFRCAAFPLVEVADPTGAGDSFLGALAGHLASTGKSEFSFDDIRQAIVYGSVVASFTCEAFSTNRLANVTREDIEARLTLLKNLTHWPE